MNRTIKKITVILFVTYAFFLMYVLFFNSRFANLTDWTYWSYIKRSINIVPLKTIGEYFARIAENTINVSTVVKNIVGNIVVFMPMGFLLPCIWKKLRRPLKAIAGGFIIILSVEIIQLFSTLGSFDVDDIILNLLGFSVGFLLFKIKPINALLKKLTVI
ncbi:MAG: VanZ family protein [Clostridia bacterium]|nr:VanZ family protein [Clostridia bacterium]